MAKKKTSTKRPFAKSAPRMPKRKPKPKPKRSTGTKQKNNLTRVIWGEIWGTGKSYSEKDIAQKALYTIFVWFPKLLWNGTIYWLQAWTRIKYVWLRMLIFPILIVIWTSLFLFLFIGYVQVLVALSLPIMFILSIIILYWFHRIANNRRKWFRDMQVKSNAYRRAYPNRTSSLPRVKRGG